MGFASSLASKMGSASGLNVAKTLYEEFGLNMTISMKAWRLLWPLRSKLQRGQGLQLGEHFPDFTLHDLQGQAHMVPDDAGKRWTILWFTNLCEDCRGRIPLLQEVVKQEAGFRVLAVSLLAIDDPLPQKIASNLGFPILIDPEDIVTHRLGLAHPPATCPMNNLYVLDGIGKIVFKHHLSAIEPEAFRKIWTGQVLP